MSKKQTFDEQMKKLENLEKEQEKPKYKHDPRTYKTKAQIKAEKAEQFEYTEIEDVEEYEEEISEYFDSVSDIENDTTYTKHGMLTEDKRYNDTTSDIVKKLRNIHKLSNDQAYYFHYFAVSNGLSYEETKEQLLSSKDFENYDKLKRARRGEV